MQYRLFSILILILITSAFVSDSFAQDHSQWNLPEDAIARFGKGDALDVAYSPDGNRIAFSTHTGIWIHNANTGEEIDMLEGKNIHWLAYSPDGLLLAASESGRVVLWDTTSYVIKDTFSGGSGVAFSPDGKLLATGTGISVLIWDVHTGRLKKTLQGGGNGVAYSPNGKYVASGGGWEGTIFLWDVTTGQLISSSKQHNCFAEYVTFSPDSKTLVTSGLDGGGRRGAHLWDTDTGKHRNILRGSGGRTAFSPDGNLLANAIDVWDFSTGNIIGQLKPYTSETNKVTFSPDGKSIAGSGYIWNATGGEAKLSLNGYGGDYLGTVVFSPDGEKFLHSNGVTTQLWDVNSWTSKETLVDNGRYIRISPDWKTIAYSYPTWGDHIVRLWDIESRKVKHNLQGHTNFTKDMAFSPDGNRIASGSDDKTIRLWDPKTAQHIHTFIGHTSRVESVTFSPDSQTLASGSADGSIRLWNVQRGEHIDTLNEHRNGVVDIAFSGDGSILASVSWDRSLRFWNPNTHTQTRSLTYSVAPVRIAFNPDNTIIAAGFYNGQINLLETSTGKIIHVLEGHGGMIQSINFNPDGQLLASVGASGTAFIWDLTPYLTRETQLNTGIEQYEREMVQLIYFRPNDRPQRQTIDSEMDTLIRWTQYFFSEQMDDYGRKTFAFELEPNGRAKVHHITGQFADSHYHQDTYNKVVKEVSEKFDTSKNVYLIAIDVSTEYINQANTCGIGGGKWLSHNNELWGREFGGVAVLPASGICVTPSIAAHELGHAFGLEHDFREDTYLMAYGTQTRLSRCACEWLDAHRLFNNDPTFFNNPSSINLQVSPVSGQNEFLLKFELTDSDGLHQAQLIVPTTQNDPAQGSKLQGCRNLSGNNQNIEFIVDNRAIPIGSEVTLQLIDKVGNIARQRFSIRIEEPTTNQHPELIQAIPPQSLVLEDGAISVQVTAFFSDPDGDILSFYAISDKTDVATVSISGGRLTILPMGVGNATVTLTVSDGKLQIRQTITVQVENRSTAETTPEDSTLTMDDDKSLLLHLSFDELNGRQTTDSSQYQNNGTLVGNPQLVDGKFGKAVKLNGINDWVEIPHDDSLTVDKNFTVMAWINTPRHRGPNNAQWQAILGKSNFPRSYSLYTEAKGVLHLSVGQWKGSESEGKVALNEWQHIVAQMDDGWIRYWINGERAGNFQVNATLPGTSDRLSVRIGNVHENGREYLGMIDEVRIYNRALSEDEIKLIMNTDSFDSLEPIDNTPDLIATAGFSDNFTGNSLQNRNWNWQNEPATWDVGETKTDYLHIDAETNRNLWTSDDTHFLYQETDADTFDVETHFIANWDTSSGVNGLLVKSPTDNNWVTIKFWSQHAGINGQIQYQTRAREFGNGLTGNAGYRPNFGSTELFFRLRKNGDVYTAWYKTNSADRWIEIGTTHLRLTPPLQLGIYAGVEAADGTLSVDYEYFRDTVNAAAVASLHIEPVRVETPKITVLLPNYPNPFNPDTWIPYQLSASTEVTVFIHSVEGVLVRRLSLGYQAAGSYQRRARAMYWDGKNAFGEKVASGVYFYTLTAGEFSATRRMLILK